MLVADSPYKQFLSWQSISVPLLQVVELPREGPEAALKLFGGLPNLRVLVIGGDGTVAWILSCIDSIQVCSCAQLACHVNTCNA